MPFTLVSRRTNRLPSRSTSPPGGHAHVRHTVSSDRLHISLSDPVLVAAEKRLSNVPDRSKLSIIKEFGARKTASPVVSHPTGETRSPMPGDYNDHPLATGALNRSLTTSSAQGISSGHFCKVRLHSTAAQGLNLPNLTHDSSDIAEIMTVMSVDVSPGNADTSDNVDQRASHPALTNDTSLHGPDLAPLASEAFKEELYVKGYLKRPASRPTNIVQRKPRASLVSMSRRVLGRRRGRKVAECLRAEQSAADTRTGPDAQLSESHLSTTASVTLRILHADSLGSPGRDTNTSTSESFDLHEFSYITAFTTPPSSPSIVLEAEMFKKRVNFGDSKHAV